jgi:Tfp pilus assembly protein PilZ
MRFAVRCQCWLESDEASIFGPTADIGLGGLFLRTAVPMTPGQPLEIALSLGAKTHAVVARGVVTRAVRAERGRRHGVGVAFVDIVDGRAVLESFLGTSGLA